MDSHGRRGSWLWRRGPRCRAAVGSLPAPALGSPHCAQGLQRVGDCAACKLPSLEDGVGFFWGPKDPQA